MYGTASSGSGAGHGAAPGSASWPGSAGTGGYAAHFASAEQSAARPSGSGSTTAGPESTTAQPNSGWAPPTGYAATTGAPVAGPWTAAAASQYAAGGQYAGARYAATQTGQYTATGQYTTAADRYAAASESAAAQAVSQAASGSGAAAEATTAPPATWQQAEAPATWQQSEAPAAWQQTDAADASIWVPERYQRAADSAPFIEVLPAALTSADLLADISAANRARLKSSTGVRGALNKVGFNLGLSPAEQRVEDRRGRIRRQLLSTYQIAVISVKGGVGRTTTAATLGSTFAALRPDRVVAIDANPDFGDLPSRTSPHPYGLSLRDLAQASSLDSFATVQSFMSINSADLAVIASPWNAEAIEALSGREYMAAMDTLRRHFNLLLVDCGTGVLDSVTTSVLRTSDAVVVVTPATVGGVKGAVATLNWLNTHGLSQLIAKSVVAIVHHQPTKPIVEVEAIEKLFQTAQRPTRLIPYDPHLAEGGEIDLRLLDKETLLAFEELAAGLSDGFPTSYLNGADRGGWR
ncbi:MinD/ParA family ATP-binding protein [Nocardia sp. alder85J]|uniref:MinD/ParA family ATP-binding protein n=1 Tax=Nocardia sp. alder85J TaxID=2862949 RepID=UPI001CD4B5EF|nr:MinD/ParA family protein [Nocardia sp. alder85J]MCX4092199.1 MinD/ParA family protein [Nocardia sp. alder85J]